MKTEESGTRNQESDSNHERQWGQWELGARRLTKAVVRFICEVHVWCERTGNWNIENWDGEPNKTSMRLGLVVNRDREVAYHINWTNCYNFNLFTCSHRERGATVEKDRKGQNLHHFGSTSTCLPWTVFEILIVSIFHQKQDMHAVTNKKRIRDHWRKVSPIYA